MQIVGGRIYKIAHGDIGQQSFIVCKNEIEMLETIAHKFRNVAVSGVTEIQYGGKTPRVAVMTNPYYKKERKLEVDPTKGKGKLIVGRLFRITAPSESRVQFVAGEERGLLEYIATNWVGTPVNVVEIRKDGKTPKVAVYTNDKK